MSNTLYVLRTALSHITRQRLKEVRVVQPTVDEQRRVADFLDDRVSRIDNIIAARQRQSGALEKEYSAWQARAFDDAASRSGLTRLRRFMLAIEQGWSPQCAAVPAEQGESGVIKLGAVRAGEFRPGENKAMLDIEPEPRYRLRVGDFLVTRANTPALVGDAASVSHLGDAPLHLSDLVYRVTATCSSDFLSFALRSAPNRQLVSALARGTSQSMVKLRGEDVADLLLPAVGPEMQEALGEADLAHRLALAQQRAELGRSIDLLTEYKQSLITAAVTGELDVTAASTAVSV